MMAMVTASSTILQSTGNSHTRKVESEEGASRSIMNELTQNPGVEVDSNFNQFVSEAIAYLDPENSNRDHNSTYYQDAESLITLVVLLGGAFVSYSIILIHLLGLKSR